MSTQQMKDTRSVGGQRGESGREWRSQGRERKERRVGGEGNGSAPINDERLARGLGWFSIGLGLVEVAAPRTIAKLLGVRHDHRMLLRGMGLREIATGIGILAQRTPVESVWARVAGDAVDLALLTAALTSPQAKSGRLAAAAAAVGGITFVDVVCAQQLSRGRADVRRLVHHKKSLTIQRSAEDLYRFWHDFANLPRFMTHLESVHMTGEGRWHWVAKAPGGTTVEWDADITDDHPRRRIAWHSVEGADVENVGSVRFEPAPGGRGTVVNVDIRYSPPGGAVGAAIATLLAREPGQLIQDDLRRFKQMMEIGEVVTTEGQPSGRRTSTSWKYDRAGRV